MMTYLYKFCIFDRDEPTEKDIKEAMNDDQFSISCSQRELKLYEIAKTVAYENCWDWNIADEDNIYIAVYPDDDVEKLQLINVKFKLKLNISVDSISNPFIFND